MSLYFQTKINGILYTLRAVPTPDFPAKEIPYTDQLKSQFVDIIENHSIAAITEAEKPLVHALAADQVREYNAAVAKDAA
jgi:hypothetical protein